MGRIRVAVGLAAGLATVAAVVHVARHHVGAARGHVVVGGMLMDDAGAYDRMSRLLLGSLFRSIAADVAATSSSGARTLEVGCGPGHLSLILAQRHGLRVTGLDLDPAMIERADRNAKAAAADGNPAFVAGDVAALPFPDGSFDVVVSTLSMHHWSDPAAGLADIARVLRPGGRALVWDFRPGAVPLHRDMADPLVHVHGGPIRIVSVEPWLWPWRFSFAQRIELARADAADQGSQAD